MDWLITFWNESWNCQFLSSARWLEWEYLSCAGCTMSFGSIQSILVHSQHFIKLEMPNLTSNDYKESIKESKTSLDRENKNCKRHNIHGHNCHYHLKINNETHSFLKIPKHFHCHDTQKKNIFLSHFLLQSVSFCCESISSEWKLFCSNFRQINH